VTRARPAAGRGDAGSLYAAIRSCVSKRDGGIITLRAETHHNISNASTLDHFWAVGRLEVRGETGQGCACPSVSGRWTFDGRGGVGGISNVHCWSTDEALFFIMGGQWCFTECDLTGNGTFTHVVYAAQSSETSIASCTVRGVQGPDGLEGNGVTAVDEASVAAQRCVFEGLRHGMFLCDTSVTFADRCIFRFTAMGATFIHVSQATFRGTPGPNSHTCET